MSDLDTAAEGAEVVAEIQETPEVEAVVTPESTAGDEGEHQDKPEKGVQKRINELTREKWEERRARQELERRLQEIEARSYQAQAPSQAPTLEQFNYDTEAYQRAVFQYAQTESQRQFREQFEQERQMRAQQEQQRQFQSMLMEHDRREAEFARSVPDYHEAVESLVSSLRLPQATVEVMASSERSPEILYHFATNFEEAAKLSEMPPHLAALHIARLEAKLANKPKPVSKAPAPPPSLTGAAQVNKSPEQMSDEEFYAARRAGKL